LTFILLLGTAISFTGIREQFEKHSFSRRGLEYFEDSIGEGGIRGLSGRIVGLDGQFVIIQTPHQTAKLRIREISANQLLALEPDQFIAAVGEKDNDEFIVEKFKIVDINDMRIIRRGVLDRFGPIDPRARGRMQAIKKCFNDCLLEKIIFELCRQRCLFE